MSSIIEVNNLSKSFIISHEGSKESYTALRDVMAKKAKKIFSFSGSSSTKATSKEEFWALKDVSFNIEQGDRVGIVGRNGAGKSTLLKILSRITEPTKGQIRIKGRVASLLEVGTGFHPELTGRENIFLNGAILGMSRAEIRAKFDEIVDFAEVEKFLDTPVKRYSSGMYVRLAFAVAAHLEPEILVIDEVLAVGDAQFQKKCLGKMEDVSKNEGRTVLFVSHNISALLALTNTSILLKNGALVAAGSSAEIINDYSRNSFGNQADNIQGKGKNVSLRSVKLFDENRRVQSQFHSGSNIILEFSFEIHHLQSNLSFDLFLKDILDTKIAFYSSANTDGYYLKKQEGLQKVRLTISLPYLASGEYYFDVFTALTNVEWDHKVEKACQFEIVNSNPNGLTFDLKQSMNYGLFSIKTLQIDLQ